MSNSSVNSEDQSEELGSESPSGLHYVDHYAPTYEPLNPDLWKLFQETFCPPPRRGWLY